MAPIINLDGLLLPELYQLRVEALRLFNFGNMIRVSSGLTAETTNGLKDFVDSVDAKIASFQINNNT